MCMALPGGYNRGNFRVKGDDDIYLAYSDNLLRVMFYWDDEIDAIEEIDPISRQMATFDEPVIGQSFMTTKESRLRAIHQTRDDLTVEKWPNSGRKGGKMYEAGCRLYERDITRYGMIREPGIRA